MNDRYLFRAKRTDNGEWIVGNRIDDGVTGQVFIHAAGNTANESDKVGEDGYLRFIAFEVDPSTICQCTGLKDKNGKLIFENDLVEINGTIYQCFWNDSNFEWGFKNNSEDFGIAYVSSDDIRIAGNIFDNPELLEVGE